ncbi:uncharacterized protein F4822DRAFT_198327 [Hypoxylon trugodes]|uniref:uncharacterized protein n=1 Tax=Hypoxylon trugodes TaxID=326681 RepID=UPI00219EBF0A|nr:uncharacterized protein F4822DRAFT_198327 [Hypoxylon trugodes]KAI1389364.1 hypothetical protein F4822DRAFT_198327 [Hypoxylon trugodes]
MAAALPSPDQFPPGYLEENNGGRVIAAATTILVITTILFALRLYARSLTSAARGWDDHVLIPAYILLLGLIGSLYAEVLQAGLGRHVASVMMEDPKKVNRYLMLLYILDWFYVPSNMLSRVSVVVLYLRIFTDKWARIACYAVIGFLVANCLATIIAAQLECTPLAYTWDRSIQGGKCFNQLLWYQLTNFPNILGDVLIMILPIRTIWGLKASVPRRAGIAAVCLTGSIGMIASCVRTSVFYTKGDVILNDPTFADEAFSWTAIECGMYFSAACLIGMRPLYSRLPAFLKTRFPNATEKVEGALSHQADRLRLKRPYNSDYSSIHGDESSGSRGRGSVQHPQAAMVPTYQTRDDFMRDANRSQIYVETNIEIRRDFDRYYP